MSPAARTVKLNVEHRNFTGRRLRPIAIGYAGEREVVRCLDLSNGGRAIVIQVASFRRLFHVQPPCFFCAHAPGTHAVDCPAWQS